MIKKLNQTCKKFNDTLGVSIKLPEPKKSTLKAASVYNFVMGVGLLAVSIIFEQKWFAVAGGLSIISSIVLKHEGKEKEVKENR